MVQSRGQCRIGDRRAIGDQDMRQQHATDRAMGRARQATKRPRQPMHSAQPRIGKRQPTAQADPCHLVARLRILGLHQTDQRRQTARYRIAAQRIGQRIGAGADIGLDHLRDGIKARGQRDRPRAAIGQSGINNCNPGQHPHIPQADLAGVLFDRDHGVACDLGAGPGSGRQRHEGQGRVIERQTRADNLQMVDHRAGGGGECRNGLARIDDRPAAKSHHYLGPGRAGDRDAGFDDRGIGFLGHCKAFDRASRRRQTLCQRLASCGIATLHQQDPFPECRHPDRRGICLTPSEQDLGCRRE